MNPNEMTLDECRDWCARDAGWTHEGPPNWKAPGFWKPPGWPDCNQPISDHPFPATLDGAAAAMPDGRWIAVTRWKRCIGTDAEWQAQSGGDSALEPSVVTGGPTEILARYRLAVACRMAMKEATR